MRSCSREGASSWRDRHRNSVLEGRFEELEVGTNVRFAEEEGLEGPQASTVHVMR